VSVKVRVERIRRGQRTAEVEYIVTKAPRKRRPLPEGDGQVFDASSDPWDMDGQASELRLPWRLNSRRS
jgi:hypothetical protein